MSEIDEELTAILNKALASSPLRKLFFPKPKKRRAQVKRKPKPATQTEIQPTLFDIETTNPVERQN